VQALETFRDEIAAGVMQPLHEETADRNYWNQALADYEGLTWLQVPWYFAETYFYRRLLQAVRYFQPGPWERVDPFAIQKQEHDTVAVEQLAGSWGRLDGVKAAGAFQVLLHSCLWGNRADLSYRAVLAGARGGLAAREEQEHLLIDHTETTLALLASGLQQVAFINDNSGMELLCDLALADFLLRQGWAQEVVFHLKDRPFFVSDAMPNDVRALIESLLTEDDTAMQALGERLDGHLAQGDLLLRDDAPQPGWVQGFWTSCHSFRSLPPRVRRDLGRAGLILLKGDANYRRLLGDRHWPHTTRLEDAARTFPAPFLTLRTLKAEIMVGLQPGQAEALAAEDPDWLINGKRGIIQYVAAREALGSA
jgi:hypothetical protein